MTRRLASWKSKFFNMTDRATLATSTLSSMSNHIMQYNYIPIKILKYIDKIQRNFIWGSTTTTKKIHLINWRIDSSDKRNGGLGIHAATDKNLVNLANLTWRLINNTQTPWATILSSIYGSTNNFKNSSFIW